MQVIKSAERVFAVLKLFSQQQAPLTATEICKYLGYPKSSADALLKSMVTLGYLTLNPGDVKYFPSLQVTKLGDWLPNILLGRGDTLNMLDDLHSLTGETITLSMPSGLSMQFITVLQGTFPISLTIREGLTVPIFGTAVGTAHLATQSDDEIVKLARRANRRPGNTEQHIDINAAMREIEEARANGYAEAYDRVLTDTGAIAMALPTSQLDRAAVVTVGGLSERMRASKKQIVQKMRKVLWQLGRSQT